MVVLLAADLGERVLASLDMMGGFNGVVWGEEMKVLRHKVEFRIHLFGCVWLARRVAFPYVICHSGGE